MRKKPKGATQQKPDSSTTAGNKSNYDNNRSILLTKIPAIDQ